MCMMILILMMMTMKITMTIMMMTMMMIFHYDDEDFDYGMLGSMVQVFEVATNTAACTTATDPRGSATNPWFRPLTNTPRIV